MSRTSLQVVLLVLLSLWCVAAAAQPRAWLDRDRIAAGETVTLNILAEGGGAPDYAPLQADFELSGRTSRRQVEMNNGEVTIRTLHAVALRPRQDGVVTVPALQVGRERTQPLSLVVAPASASTPTRAGDDVFLESEADDSDPYVQQAVGWVVRLYSAVPLVSGSLDQPSPDGASLRQVGDDAQFARDIQGRRYTVIERRYQLIPEASGPLTIPGAKFQGRGAAGFFDDFLGRSGSLSAQAPARRLDVRPVPADAPQPWLPLHDLQLRYAATPADLQAGSAATVTVELAADGASAAQLPELRLPPIDGVQVFAEPVQADERFVDGRPRVTLTRAFSLVPAGAGEVTLPGLEIEWWDVAASAVRTARLPALDLVVGAGSGADPLPPLAAPAPMSPVGTTASGGTSITADSGSGWLDWSNNRVWIIATVAFALLWLLTLAWAMHRPDPSPGLGKQDAAPETVAPADRGGLVRALDVGALSDVAHALCAMARPPVANVDQLRNRLADRAQVEAVDAMERARWGDGDGVQARSLLRSAFANGPSWKAEPAPADAGPLPPLYP